MRFVIVLMVCVPMLAGCATDAEAAGLNNAIYNHCVSESARLVSIATVLPAW